MRTMLIIPCGISQLSFMKFSEPLKDLSEEYKSFERILKDKQRAAPSPEEQQRQVARFVEHFRHNWEMRKDELGSENSPYGAEIHTLISLESRLPTPAWTPERDSAVLLASDTRIGTFAATILREVLVNLWGMPADQVAFEIIGDLSEKPNNAETAMENLARAIIRHLKTTSQSSYMQPEWHNILVMSGGFKSVIPCLTTFSLIYGLEMAYMYEMADIPQALHPRYNYENLQALKFWRKVWVQMKKQGWMSSQASSYLRIALEGRIMIDQEGNLVF